MECLIIIEAEVPVTLVSVSGVLAALLQRVGGALALLQAIKVVVIVSHALGKLQL